MDMDVRTALVLLNKPIATTETLIEDTSETLIEVTDLIEIPHLTIRRIDLSAELLDSTLLEVAD